MILYFLNTQVTALRFTADCKFYNKAHCLLKHTEVLTFPGDILTLESILYFNDEARDITKNTIIINPRRACAARVGL